MSSQVWWFVARSSGIVSWALLSFAVVWGLLMATRTASRLTSRPWLLDVHRFSGGLAVAFTGLHLIGLAADDYVHFGWAELFVPMASSWNPGAVAWGIVALYLLLAVEVTSLLMHRLPRRWWRRVHWSSLPLWVIATHHGLVAGTDRGNDVWRVATLVAIGVVTVLTLVLIVAAVQGGRGVRASATRAAAGVSSRSADRAAV